MKRVIRPPTVDEYERAELQAQIAYAPRFSPCMKCGWPVREGYCCNTCGDNNPTEPNPEPTHV